MGYTKHMDSLVGFDEDLPVTVHHDVYPTISPEEHFSQKTFSGKIVFITGASRGIGQETAKQYARAGASVAIVARTQSALDETSDEIASVERAVRETLQRFGRLDVLIANAGGSTSHDKLLGDKDVNGWWNTIEVNLRGVYNSVHSTIREIQKAKGHIVVVPSGAAQRRLPHGSDYCVAKYAVGRLVEFIAIEYPQVTAFAMHPGCLRTKAQEDAAVFLPIPFDKIELPAATMLYLTSGSVDWLNGRYVSANWDLGEVEKGWKARIMEKGGLVSKLYIPA
ncbi:NAD-P-binding protein [Gloeopeniophorella convolvens]|nr:NAD-P-binding protein [Gloeopeniophorella convolvens]